MRSLQQSAIVQEREIITMKTATDIRNIILSDKVTANAVGPRTNGNCKLVFRLNDMELYTSVTDAAEKNNIHPVQMSMHLHNADHVFRNGKKFCLYSDLPKYFNKIHEYMSAMETDKADAEKWRAHEAEQEEIRKAEEKRQQKIHALNLRIETHKRMRESYLDKANKSAACIAKLEAELADLEK